MDAGQLPQGPGVYVIHFEPPLRHARNYLGSAANLRARVAADLAGTGAKMVAAALARGITCTVSRTWQTGTHELAWQTEVSLKNRRDTPRFCPGCTPGTTRAASPRPATKRTARRHPPVRKAA